MDLAKHKFPKVSGADVAFPTMKTDKLLLAEAHARGFYNGHTKYNDLFSQMFFNGGTLDFKKDLDQDFKDKALPYLRAFMGSWEPKHQEKEAICAMLLSELVNA